MRYFGVVVTHSNITTPYLIFAKNFLDSLQYTSLTLNEKYEFWFEYHFLFATYQDFCTTFHDLFLTQQGGVSFEGRHAMQNERPHV